MDTDIDNKKLASLPAVTSSKDKSNNKKNKEKLASALRDNLRRRKIATQNNSDKE